MKYKGKSVVVIGSKTLFGKETLWVHVLEDNKVLMNNLHAIFHRMETDIQANLQVKAERKLKALKYVEHRLHRIGIENIRKAKIKKLQAQRESWENTFAQDRSVVPDVKHILTVRIDG